MIRNIDIPAGISAKSKLDYSVLKVPTAPMTEEVMWRIVKEELKRYGLIK